MTPPRPGRTGRWSCSAGPRPVRGGGLEGEGLEHALTLSCLSRFDGAEEAKAIVAAVRARLHGADLALDGWRLVNLRVTYADVFRAADGRTVQGVLRVRAVTEGI